MNYLKSIVFYAYVVLFYFFTFLILWIYQKFGSISFDLIFINLQIILFNYKVINKELSIINSIKYWLIFIPIIFTIFTISFDTYLKKHKKINNFFLNLFKNKNILIIKNEFVKKFRLFFFIISFLFFVLFITINFNFSEQLKSKIKHDKEDKFKLIYNKPQLEMTNPNNILVIFLESFDKSYLNKKNINNILLNEESYKQNFKERIYEPFTLINSPGTQWSMGSMIAVLCGLPFKPKKEGFLNNSKCINDYLNELNFETEFITSTPNNFHDLNDFLDNHKFDKIFTRDYFIEKGFDININSFADTISDIDLLDFVYSRIRNKLNTKKNFFIFAQTLDTHSPGNFFDRVKCKNFINEDIFVTKKMFKNIILPKNLSQIDQKNYYELTKKVYEDKHLNYVDKRLLNVNFECLSFYLMNLIHKIENLNIPNLYIYMITDHKFMWKDNNLKNNQLLNIIYSNLSKDDQLSNKQIKLSHYDLFPYLLHLSGFNLKSKHAGVGFLFPKNKENSLILRDQIIEDFLINGSATYDNLWFKQ